MPWQGPVPTTWKTLKVCGQPNLLDPKVYFSGVCTEPCHSGTSHAGMKAGSTGLADAPPANAATQGAALCQASRSALWDTKSFQKHPELATHAGIHNAEIQMLPQGHKKPPAQLPTTACGASILPPTCSSAKREQQLTREP